MPVSDEIQVGLLFLVLCYVSCVNFHKTYLLIKLSCPGTLFSNKSSLILLSSSGSSPCSTSQDRSCSHHSSLPKLKLFSNSVTVNDKPASVSCAAATWKQRTDFIICEIQGYYCDKLRLSASGIGHCIMWCTGSDVLEESTAEIFRAYIILKKERPLMCWEWSTRLGSVTLQKTIILTAIRTATTQCRHLHKGMPIGLHPPRYISNLNHTNTTPGLYMFIYFYFPKTCFGHSIRPLLEDTSTLTEKYAIEEAFASKSTWYNTLNIIPNKGIIKT